MVEASVVKDAAKAPQTITAKRKYQAFEAYVTTGETITLDVGTLVGTAVFKASDGTAVTHTKALGVITVTLGGLTDEHVYGMGVGAA
jgi:hypothetical protein